MLDGLGNRSQVLTTPPTPPSTVTYASDVVNQYTQVGGVTRTHDNNGNLKDDGTYLFAYDFENRLVEVKLKATQAVIATYRYDALGRRVEKAVSGGATTRYVLDGPQVVEEYDAQDVWQGRYVYEDGIDRPRVMDRADQADVNGNQNTAEVLRFTYHQQALGSVTEVSEPGGSVVEWVSYDVYGKPTILDQQGNVVGQSPVGNPFLFTGREFDPEDGLYFYRARQYDPVVGKFLQQDPVGMASGPDTSEFVRSSPATFVDPTGLKGVPPPAPAGKKVVSPASTAASSHGVHVFTTPHVLSSSPARRTYGPWTLTNIQFGASSTRWWVTYTFERTVTDEVDMEESWSVTVVPRWLMDDDAADKLRDTLFRQDYRIGTDFGKADRTTAAWSIEVLWSAAASHTKSPAILVNLEVALLGLAEALELNNEYYVLEEVYNDLGATGSHQNYTKKWTETTVWAEVMYLTISGSFGPGFQLIVENIDGCASAGPGRTTRSNPVWS